MSDLYESARAEYTELGGTLALLDYDDPHRAGIHADMEAIKASLGLAELDDFNFETLLRSGTKPRSFASEGIVR